MKNYLLTMVAVSIAAMAGYSEGPRPQVTLKDPLERHVKSVEEVLQRSRERLASLAKNDPLTLKRFDQFASNLEALYRHEHALNWNQLITTLNALEFAAEKHQFQTRKNKAETPYISHPIGVTNHLVTVGEVSDFNLIIAALLHDTLEGGQTTYEEIVKRFGKEVAGYVKEMTDDKSLSKEQRKRLEVISASHKSAGAAQIKCADHLYNLTDLLQNPPEGWSRRRVDQYFEWAESVINRLPSSNPQLKQAIDQVINQYWESQDTKKSDSS
jgi:guanosine-3',5'-bis(diphosphate) 3'-pyrophosphohydrolase